MFVFNRSAAAVLLPLALLIAVVMWSGRTAPAVESARQRPAAESTNTVAQNPPARRPGG